MTVIPKRIFRIWLGPKKIKPLFQVWWERFHELHPGWELETVRDRDVETFPSFKGEIKKIFNYCSTQSERSDVLRYVVLYELGGVYIDTDVFPIKPFDDLMDDPKPFFCWQTKKCLESAVIGAPPKHPAIKAVMDAFPGHYWDHSQDSAHVSTGPAYMSTVIIPRNDVRKLPREAFLPVGRCSAKKFIEKCLKSDGYACNFAAGSWWAEAKHRRETNVRQILPTYKPAKKGGNND